MIADSSIDDFAAALVGRLKAEVRESKATREDFFAQLLHDNLSCYMTESLIEKHF